MRKCIILLLSILLVLCGCDIDYDEQKITNYDEQKITDYGYIENTAGNYVLKIDEQSAVVIITDRYDDDLSDDVDGDDDDVDYDLNDDYNDYNDLDDNDLDDKNDLDDNLNDEIIGINGVVCEENNECVELYYYFIDGSWGAYYWTNENSATSINPIDAYDYILETKPDVITELEKLAEYAGISM